MQCRGVILVCEAGGRAMQGGHTCVCEAGGRAMQGGHTCLPLLFHPLPHYQSLSIVAIRVLGVSNYLPPGFREMPTMSWKSERAWSQRNVR